MTKVQTKRVRIYKGHNQGIYTLAATTQGRVFSAGADATLFAWEPLKSDQGVLLGSIQDAIYSSLYVEDTETLLLGSRSGNFIVVNQNGGIRKFIAHQYGIFALCHLPNSFILTAGGDGKLKIWNQEYEIVAEHQIATKAIRCVIFNPSSSTLIAGSSDNNIYCCNLGLEVLTVLQGHHQSVFALALDHEGKTLFSGGRDAKLMIWELETGNVKKTINAHWYHIHSLSLNPKHKILASSSMDKTIKLWDTETYELLKVIDPFKMESHTHSINKVLWLNEEHLLSASDDRNLQLFEVKKN